MNAPVSRGAADLLLGYSTNVHPGEDLRQLYRSLREYTVPIRDRVFGRRPAGLELRLGIGAARELKRRGAREELAGFLRDSGLQVFSINAYPLLDFHQRRVKESAYRPPWTERARALWTRTIAGIFADLLEPGVVGSISTLGGSYRAWGNGPREHGKIARHYLEVVEALAEIEDRTGKRIVIAAEPEPDTTFETAGDVISFFEDHLQPAARARREGPLSGWNAEALLRRHFTVNLDTCHLSVLFKSPSGEMARLAGAGIGIGKVHVTSALAVRAPARRPQAYRALRKLHEPRYLHQVRGADREGAVVLSGPDLDCLPASPAGLEAGGRRVAEVRAHFHVPVHAARWRELGTTRADTREAVLTAIRKKLCPQLVIETYTWPLLASEDALIDGIVREFRWLLGAVSEAGGR